MKAKHKLYIKNNDIYTVNEMIDTLGYMLNIHSQQAEQLVTIAHYTGQSCIREAGKKTLQDVQKQLGMVLPELETEIVKGEG